MDIYSHLVIFLGGYVVFVNVPMLQLLKSYQICELLRNESGMCRVLNLTAKNFAAGFVPTL